MSKLGRLYFTLTEEIKMPKEYIMKLSSEHLIYLEKIFHYLDEELFPYNDTINFTFEESSVSIEVFEKCYQYSYRINYIDLIKERPVKQLMKERLTAIMEREKEEKKL